MQGSFMSLINHQYAITGQIRFGEELSQEHPVRHVLDYGFFTGTILKANRVSHLVQNGDLIMSV